LHYILMFIVNIIQIYHILPINSAGLFAL